MSNSGLSLDHCLERIARCELPTERTVKLLCDALKEMLVNEPNIVSVSSPITVVGDLHGQFYDLVEMFHVAGACPDTNYLFLGDYVDRGSFSVETLSYLLFLKLRWPNRVTLLRGNHESKMITQVYGFYAECMRKYGNATVWNHFIELFNYLPVAAIINNSIYCVHGGISPNIETLNQLRVLDRFQEPTHDSPLIEIMWSDPDTTVADYEISARGVGYLFGSKQVDQFLRFNHLDHIVRSHQLCMDGFQQLFKDSLTTIWSAPNYCYRCGNLAAVMNIAEDLTKTFAVYPAAPDYARKRVECENNKEVPDYFL